MKLQISFDMVDLDKALKIASQVTQYASIIEIGTLLIFKYGVHSIEQFRKQFPNKILLADSKITDRSKEAVNLMAKAGADWITVMAGTSNDVIHSTCTAAHELNKKVMIDLMDACSLGQSALEAKSLGADALLFHKPYDDKDALLFLEKWDMVRGNTDLPVMISGRISREMIDKIVAINPNPNGIIIGKEITDAANPAQEALFFHEHCTVK